MSCIRIAVAQAKHHAPTRAWLRPLNVFIVFGVCFMLIPLPVVLLDTKALSELLYDITGALYMIGERYFCLDQLRIASVRSHAQRA